jgi:EAL domain-containing protein (putative c-di-GMP-specific phosphodiesterase class I)
MGIRLSIDNFGTGYSSLDHIKKLPINEVTIAKPFVTGMVADENDAVLVHSIITLAHNLGLKVNAEGVEDHETLNRLAALDCDAAQGFLMAPPLPQAEITRWLSESPWGLSPTPQ